jgi:PAS domain-containing protein
MDAASAVRLAISTASVLAAGGLALAVWPDRHRPTARRLAGVALVVCLGSLLHLLVVDLSGPGAVFDLTGWRPTDLLWVVLDTTASVVAAGIWSSFAFRYAGHGRGVDRLATVGIAVLSLACLAVAVRAVTRGPSVTLVNALAVGYLLVGFLAAVGVFLLLWASVGSNAFPVREPLVLSGGVVVLLSGVHVAQVFDSPTLYPAALLVASVSFLVPVWRYPIFETLPAARVAGRDRVVDEMTDGVVVADRAGVIRDVNPAAETLFDVAAENAVGRPLSAVLGSVGDPEAVIASQEPVQVETEGRTVEVTGPTVTSESDRSFGTLLVCTDVTDRRIREEQLTLLSRFVADGVREYMADVTGAVPADEAGVESEPASRAGRVWDRATELTTLVALARELERAIAAEGDAADAEADLRPRIRAVADRVGEAQSVGVRVETPADPFSVALSPDPFETVLSVLLEDACERATDRVVLAATDDPPTIRIRSDGSASSGSAGADDAGMTVSVTRLVVERVGGSLSVTRDGDEREVTLRFPAPDPDRPPTGGDTTDRDAGDSEGTDRERPGGGS